MEIHEETQGGEGVGGVAEKNLSTLSYPAIEIEELRKTYPPQRHGSIAVEALRGVSFTVPRGIVLSLLGPNGAGKTTLMRILTTLTRPSSGTAKIEGCDILKDPLSVRSSLGVVFQDNHFNKYLNIWDNLLLHGRMHGLGSREMEGDLKYWLQRMGLYERRFQGTDTLSGGMQRRLALVRALIHKPKLLFLDEPTTGLDPHIRRELWDTISEMRKTATIILTTHYMEEADYLSDQIVLMHCGQVIRQGTPEEIKAMVTPESHFVLTLNQPMASQYLATLISKGYSQCRLSVLSDYEIACDVDPMAPIPPLVEAVAPEHFVRFGIVEANLESVFLQLASGSHCSPSQDLQ